MFLWLPFLSYAVVVTYTPGPNNIMSMNNAAAVGLKKSIPFNLGIFAGFAIVMNLCMFFSTVMFALIPKIELPMKICGAAYMLYLAYNSVKRANKKNIEAKGGTFLEGLFLQFLNPKIFIYGITAMSAYILPVFNSLPILIAFSCLLAFIGCTGNVCWALFGATFSKIFANHSKLIGIVMAILLIYCAVSLFI
ncbi:MAG: LysE family transporter [Elusimicrobiota bacterium]|jgi:threonine/homoserine/homoserine lactone efflux protein|nr:LysE family transporter [Elusimicrobiota bacterium]